MGAQTAPATPAASARVKGKIVAARVQGHVEVKYKNGGTLVLKDGDMLADGSEVVTSPGANVILVFSNGATVNVAEDSTLDIDQFEQDPFAGDLKIADMKEEEGTSTTKLSLAKGELVGKVVHLNVDKGSEFTVQTPVGAAGIRGTTFKITFKPGKNGKVFFVVTTTEGVVVFKGHTSSVSLPAGKQVVATFDYTTPAPGSTTPEVTTPVTLVSSDVPPAETAAIVATGQTIVDANQSVIISSTTPAPPPPPAPPPVVTPSQPAAIAPTTTAGAGTN
ncbi:MAG TPA: FecR domain-containing protein [Opitutaceae bacterium]|nr:FecR domain-containing protein [Opitutaceae bacterium]